ncbi:MAG TPA: FxLYD domain-containing protein [Vicinamibacterales bacterium]|nr:FxLYD domain-containing protein [Vicinamibacterales bacterium]
MSLLITAIACAAALLCAFQIWRMMRDERRRSDARVAALAAVIDPPGSGRPPAIFDERTRMPASRHPLLKVAIGFAAVVTLIIVVAMANDLHDDVDQAPKPAPPSLALLSMQHDRQADTFTVTGVVTNQGTAAAERISAVILALDRTGATVARVSAPIDRQVLSAGDRSSFRIAIPHGAGISRYRVSFESEEGLVRHVDRRPRLPGQVLAGGETPAPAPPARGRRAAEAWNRAAEDSR